MPEYIRAFFYVSLSVGLGTLLLKTFATSNSTEASTLYRRVGVWIMLTCVAFLGQDIWIFYAAAIAVLIYAVKNEPDPLALFAFLFLALPPLSSEVPGFGLINHLFTLTTPRLLVILVLIPTALRLLESKDIKPLGNLLPDKLLLGYLGLQFAVMLQYDSLTNALRHGFFYQMLDWLIPYFVFSRGLRSFAQLRAVFQSFLYGLSIVAVMSCFESVKHWKLYLPLYDALGIRFNSPTLYLKRGESLRSSVTADHAITLGLLFAVGLNIAVGFWKEKDGLKWKVPMLLVLVFVGLWFTYSRGPLVGAMVGLLSFAATKLKASFALALLGGFGVIVGLLFSPLGDEIRANLPLFAVAESDDTVLYRQQLLEVGIQVVLQNPWIGVPASVFARDMESMRQGEGIIDLVNAYLGISLSSGLIGLSLFLSFFLVPLVRLLLLVQITPKDGQAIVRAIFGSTVALLVILGTTGLGASAKLISVLLLGSAVGIREIVQPSKVIKPFRYTPAS
jgi:O-antigen ligase